MKSLTSNVITRRRFLKNSAILGVGITLMPKMLWASEKSELVIYNWDSYMDHNAVEKFAVDNNVKITYDYFATVEDMFAKMKEGNPGYDVIFMSDYMTATMSRLDMLVAIDQSKTPNMKNIDPDPKFSDPVVNPGLKWGLPFMWGSTGIGYRKSKVKKPIDSWKVLLDSDEYSGRMALLGDMRICIGAALKYLGYSLNSINPKEIAEARDLLTKSKKQMKTIAEDNGQDLLASGEVDVVMEWSNDIAQVVAEDSDLTFVIPKEGSYVWIDYICIPKGAKNVDNAHAFMNFLHDPKVNAQCAEFIQVATPNLAAKKLLSKEHLNNKSIWPDEAAVKNCETIIDVGEATRLYDEAWIKIKAG